MNLSTVKWAQWDKTQSRELLGLFICVCSSLCTIVAHNIAQNRPDNFPSCPPDNHHCSDDVYLRERGKTKVDLAVKLLPIWIANTMWLFGMRAETVIIITMQCSCEVQRMLSELHISVCLSVCPSTSVTQFCYLLIVEHCCLFLVVAAACQSRRSLDARRRRRVHRKVLDIRLQDTHDVRWRRQTHQLPQTDTCLVL